MTLHVDTLGTGPDLVLLHGWGTHSAIWGQLPLLLAEDHRMHLIDLPGHGFSASTSASTLVRFAELAVERMPRRDVTLLGWSLGALVAQHIALNSSERVRVLILVSATPCFVQRHDWSSALAPCLIRDFSERVRRDPAGAMQRFLSLVALGAPDPKSQAARLRLMLDERPLASADTLETGMGILQGTDLRSVVAGLRTRACVIQGAGDAIVPAPAARWLAETLPAASFHLLKGAGHAPFLSHAEQIAAVIRGVTHE